jgi:hypothetical protein
VKIDLTGIRERARLRKPQRVTLNSWAFAQLGSFIAYKARRAPAPARDRQGLDAAASIAASDALAASSVLQGRVS